MIIIMEEEDKDKTTKRNNKKQEENNNQVAVKLFMHMQSFGPPLRKNHQKRRARRTRPKHSKMTHVEVASFHLSFLVFDARTRNHTTNSVVRTTEEHPQTPNSEKFPKNLLFRNILVTFWAPTPGFETPSYV